MKHIYVHVLVYLYSCWHENTDSITFIPARKYWFILLAQMKLFKIN